MCRLPNASCCRWFLGFVPLAVCVLEQGSGGVGEPSADSTPPAEGQPLIRFEETVADGAPVEEVPFFRLLAQVRSLTEEDWQAPAPQVTLAELSQAPHRFRGRMVDVAAAVLETDVWRLPGNPSAVKTVFLVHLVDETDRLLTATVFEEPSDWGRGDAALLRGVFFKVRRYESRGGTWEEAPLLVARRLLPAPPGAVRGKVGEGVAALAAAVGTALVVLVALRFWLGRSRRSVQFRLPDQRSEDGRGAGPRRVG